MCERNYVYRSLNNNLDYNIIDKNIYFKTKKNAQYYFKNGLSY